MKIEIENYTKILQKEIVLDNINYVFESGSVYGIRGKNGSGKTMLIRAICGLIFPTSGRVRIDNEVIGKDISFPRNVGILIEEPGFLANYSGYDNLLLLSRIRNQISEADIQAIMTRFQLNYKDKKKYRKFSLGMKQKLGLCAAFMEEPDLILLDEPTNALDEYAVKQLREMIQEHKERGALILIASHDREELDLLADHIVQISNGKLEEYQ